MPVNELDSARTGTAATTIALTDYSVASRQTDAATGINEYSWQNTKASQNLGYYKSIPELKQAIDAKALWTIGKGFQSNPLTTLLLTTIKGNGKDTFNSILMNMIRVYHIQGDAFAEIIRDQDGALINLKPLDPGTIKIVSDTKGMILRYEQCSKVKKDVLVKKFEPEEMLHLSRDRIEDEIHGNSIIECCEWIILARNEAMADYKKLLHRNIYPVRVWKLDTDIPSKINTFKAKVAQAKGEGEDIFIPKDTVEMELAAVPENSSLNPLPWIRDLNQQFYQAVGVPQIIIGGSQELTQTGAQVAYLAFEQTIEEEQLYIEQQCQAQLNIVIELDFPASLQNNLLSDDRKDGSQEQQLNKPSNFAEQPL